MSTIAECRAPIEPGRKLVSIDEVISRMSAPRATGDRGSLVSATVVAPRSRASSSGSAVSRVLPECEIAIATSAGVSSAAEVAAPWTSVQLRTSQPMRYRCISVSLAREPLPPTP